MCVVRVGNSMDTSWETVSSADNSGYDDVDLKSLDVKPEYHTGRPTYTCPRCGKQFLYASHLRQHVRFHLKHRPFRCPVCSKTFVQSSNLNEHFRIHSDERPFACELCDRRFRQSSNLNYHIRTAHHDTPSGDGQSVASAGTQDVKPSQQQLETVKSFSCKFCSRKFAHACQLTNHARVHTKDRPYRCQYCQKAFAYSSNLADHERIHTGHKPYVCATCGRAFAQSSQLKVHIKAHHPNAEGGSATPLVACPVCSLQFTGLRALRDHQKVHKSATSRSAKSREGRRQSAAMKLRFRRLRSSSSKYVTRLRKSAMKRTVEHHTVSCSYVCCYCEIGFTKQRALLRHLWLHEGISTEPSAFAPDSCRVNGKVKSKSGDKFSVEVEETAAQSALLRSHHQFRCLYCTKRFAHQNEWTTHMRIHEAQNSRAKEQSLQKNGDDSSSMQEIMPRCQSDSRRHCKKRRSKKSSVRLRNGNRMSHDGDDALQALLDDSGDGEDNVEDFETTTIGHGQKETVNSLASDVAAMGRGKRAPGKKKGSSVSTSSPSRTYPCEECGRVMASAAAMHYHRRMHSGVKPFACSQCPRRFVSPIIP